MNILLASHGTAGAQAAEHQAYDLCIENMAKCEIKLTHLYVIPELWGNMLADDWLNNAATHLQFENYLQSELIAEADDNIKRVNSKLKKFNVKNSHVIKYGEPIKCLIETCVETQFDLIILGSRRPKSLSGIKSNMVSKSLTKRLPAKVLQVPHPIH